MKAFISSLVTIMWTDVFFETKSFVIFFLAGSQTLVTKAFVGDQGKALFTGTLSKLRTGKVVDDIPSLFSESSYVVCFATQMTSSIGF